MVSRPFTVIVDFDDTLFYSPKYPIIGPMVPGAQGWMNEWASRKDMYTIVWTCREGEALTDCEDHLWARKIQYKALNPPRNQWPCSHWNKSPKLYGDVTIDDRAACVPLWMPEYFGHPVVDWLVVGPYVEALYQKWQSSGGNGVPVV